MTTQFETFKAQADSILGSLADNIGKLGKVLIAAHAELKASEYDELRLFLKNRGMTEADLEASIKVAKGELDGRLFFTGVKNSKILNLSRSDQNRLLSSEKFDMAAADGTTYEKTWGEMSPDEKDQLLGPKGGSLRSAHQQRGAKPVIQKSITTFEDAEYVNKQLKLVYGTKNGEIHIAAIVEALSRSGQLETLKKDLETYAAAYA